MATLQISLNPMDYERCRFAYIASKFGHKGQTRDGGERFFDHPKTGAWMYIYEYGGRDARLICLILLHDIVEDAYLLTPYRLSLNFGEDTAYDVHALTKLPKGKETTEEYLQRVIAQGAHAIAGKLFDRLHNCRTLGSCSEEKRVDQITETEKYHLRLLIPALTAHAGEWGKLSKWLESEIKKALAVHKH